MLPAAEAHVGLKASGLQGLPEGGQQVREKPAAPPGARAPEAARWAREERLRSRGPGPETPSPRMGWGGGSIQDRPEAAGLGQKEAGWGTRETFPGAVPSSPCLHP